MHHHLPNLPNLQRVGVESSNLPNLQRAASRLPNLLNLQRAASRLPNLPNLQRTASRLPNLLNLQRAWPRVFESPESSEESVSLFIFIFLVIIFATLASNLVPCIINLLKTFLNHIRYVIRSILSFLRRLVDVVLQVLVELLRVSLSDGLSFARRQKQNQKKVSSSSSLFCQLSKHTLSAWRALPATPRTVPVAYTHIFTCAFGVGTYCRIQKLLSFNRANFALGHCGNRAQKSTLFRQRRCPETEQSHRRAAARDPLSLHRRDRPSRGRFLLAVANFFLLSLFLSKEDISSVEELTTP